MEKTQKRVLKSEVFGKEIGPAMKLYGCVLRVLKKKQRSEKERESG